MSAIFQQDGVRFAYPENWTLENPPDNEAQSEEAQLQVTVSSPGAAFWSLTRYSGLRDLRELADQGLQAMQSEYPALESDPADEVYDGTPIVGYDMNFYCLDLTNSAQIRVFHQGASTLILLSQAEDREFEHVEAVFRAMTVSLFNKV